MKRLITLIAALLITAIMVQPAAAQESTGQVATGETVNQDITVFETLNVEAGATVNGDIVVMGGHATIAGTVNGDLVVIGGQVSLTDTAVISGECILLGSTKSGGKGDSCRGHTLEADVPAFFGSMLDSLGGIQPLSPAPSRPDVPKDFHAPGPFLGVAMAILQSLVMGAIALVVATVAPLNLTRVEEAVRQKPFASGAVGLLTAVALPSLILLLLLLSTILLLICIGIIGYPIVFLLTLALMAGAILGWVAVGTVVGARLTDGLRFKARSLPVTAAVGTAALTLALGLLAAVPFMPDNLLRFGLLCIGLGAAAITQLGMKNYPNLDSGRAGDDKIDIVIRTLPDE